MAVRNKMSMEDRARQFMPFAALKGYEDMLHQKEKIVVPKIEYSEEYARTLDYKMHQIQKGQMATVIYYDGQSYLKLTGMVAKINPDRRKIKIVQTEICFDDIYDVNGENDES